MGSSGVVLPVPTVYGGVKFRSRLEARWAMYLTLIRVCWEYEPETFDLGELGWYLPDFRVSGGFAEVKHDFKVGEINKCCSVARVTGQDVFLLEGPPQFQPYRYYWAHEPGHEPTLDYFMPINYHGENRFYYSYTGDLDGLGLPYSDPPAMAAAAIARSARFGVHE